MINNNNQKNPFQDAKSFKILECSDCIFIDVCSNLCEYLNTIKHSSKKDKKKPLKLKFNIPFEIEK